MITLEKSSYTNSDSTLNGPTGSIISLKNLKEKKQHLSRTKPAQSVMIFTGILRFVYAVNKKATLLTSNASFTELLLA